MNSTVRTFQVSARPIQPDSRLPQVDPLVVQAVDEPAAICQARVLWGLDGSGHRYNIVAVDADPARRAAAVVDRVQRPVGPVVGYGFVRRGPRG